MGCPVCLNTLATPIKSCVNGHLVCNYCIENLTICPLCRGNFSSYRNLILDLILDTVKVRCKGWTHGCRVYLKLSQIGKHEDECLFLQTTQCFVETCRKDVLKVGYCNHIRILHKDTIKTTFGFPIVCTRSINLSNEEQFTDKFLLGEELSSSTFACFCQVRDGALIVSVIYIGPQENAHTFTIRLDCTFDNTPLTFFSRALPYGGSSADIWQYPMFVIRFNCTLSSCLNEAGIVLKISPTQDCLPLLDERPRMPVPNSNNEENLL